MARVFISYRRSDGADLAAKVSEALKSVLPAAAIFLDIEGIHLGEDFSQVIFDYIQNCDVVVVVVTQDWIDEVLKDTGTKPNWVRIELETALRQRKVLVPIVGKTNTDFYSLALPETVADLSRWQAYDVTQDGASLETASQDVKSKLVQLREERVEKLAQKITKPKGAIMQVWKALRRAAQNCGDAVMPEDVWDALLETAKEDFGEKRWQRVLKNYRLTCSEDVGLIIYACIIEGFFLPSEGDDVTEYWSLASLEDD